MIKVLPSDFNRLKGLNKLELNVKKMDRLQPNFKFPDNLRYLYISGNFKYIPEQITRLINLEQLYFNNSPLDNADSIPFNIYRLKNLKYFRLSNTPLSEREFNHFTKYKKYNELKTLIEKMPRCNIQLYQPSNEVAL